MRAFNCTVCGQLVFFEDSLCLACDTPLGFLPAPRELVDLQAEDGGRYVARWDQPDATGHRRCPNWGAIGCNWMIADGDLATWCVSCRTTRTRPADDDDAGIAAWRSAEQAKRRLLFQLFELGLAISPGPDDHVPPLAFDLLYDPHGHVTTGHAAGLITIDLEESDRTKRELLRARFNEPYRTMLGHLRHEVGHYYFPVLIQGDEAVAGFRSHFGDERVHYGESLQRYYDDGPARDWQTHHVSAYCSSHPWEDWAETMAHYLHIRDTLQTAKSFGVSIDLPGTAGEADAPHGVGFAQVLQNWLPLTYALNELNRSMGASDLYPFVLAPVVMHKLTFIHDLISRTSQGRRPFQATSRSIAEAVGGTSTTGPNGTTTA